MWRRKYSSTGAWGEWIPQPRAVWGHPSPLYSVLAHIREGRMILGCLEKIQFQKMQNEDTLTQRSSKTEAEAACFRHGPIASVAVLSFLLITEGAHQAPFGSYEGA